MDQEIEIAINLRKILEIKFKILYMDKIFKKLTNVVRSTSNFLKYQVYPLMNIIGRNYHR